VYSNCDSVKLYNDAVDSVYLGKKKNNGRGTHFTWENRDIRYNVLRAVGYYGGKTVVEDVVVLNNLEKAPHFEKLYCEERDLNANQHKITQIKDNSKSINQTKNEQENCVNLRNLRSKELF
jgi:hypothetical protein